MYRDHFGLATVPFGISPRLDFLFRSGAFEESMAHLVYGLENSEAIVMITGAIGTGKTMAVQSFLSHLDARYRTALVTNTRVDAKELLKLILEDLDVSLPEHADKSDLLIAFKQMLIDAGREGRRIVIVIDEAQNLGRDVLEEIRLLTNLGQGDRQPVQIVLVGQPELEAAVDGPDLAQLRQRIRVHYKLAPLTRAELARYVDHRMTVAGAKPGVFAAGALDKVFMVSRGVPRVVNTLCGDALLAAFVAGRRTVEAADVADTALAVPEVDAAAAVADESVVASAERVSPVPTATAVVAEMAVRREAGATARTGEPAGAGAAPTPTQKPARPARSGAAVRTARGPRRARYVVVIAAAAVVLLAVLAWSGQLGFVSGLLRSVDGGEPTASEPGAAASNTGELPGTGDVGALMAAGEDTTGSAPADSAVSVPGAIPVAGPTGGSAADAGGGGGDLAADPEHEVKDGPEAKAEFAGAGNGAPVGAQDEAEAVGDWYIHVSSFRTSGQAKAVAAEYEAKGHPATVRDQLVREVVWYRVYLGPHPSHDAAVHLANTMRDAGAITYYKVLRLEPGSGS